MKRNIISLSLICMMISLTACGNNDNENAINESSVVSSTTLSENNTEQPITKKEDYTENTKKNSQTIEKNNEAANNNVSRGLTNLELMSYAQTVLEDFYPKCEYSRNSRDYTFVNTDLKYKIEGNVSISKNSSEQKFCMLLKFIDEKYEQYDLILLQVGNDVIYEASNPNEVVPSDDEKSILNTENTKIYNEVMQKLNEEYDREENEILGELAQKYDMTSEELKQFIHDYMEAYYAQ